MILPRLLAILLLYITILTAAPEKEKFTSLLVPDTSRFTEDNGKASLALILDSFKQNGNNLDTKKLRSLKGVFQFLDMDQEYKNLLNKVLNENHANGFKTTSKDHKADPVKLEFYNETVMVLNEIFNKNSNICNLDEFVICQNLFFSSLNSTQENSECAYLSHISSCAANSCAKSVVVSEAIQNFTQVCSSSKKQKQVGFLKKNAKTFIKNLDKKGFIKKLKKEAENFKVSNLAESTNDIVESELYYKKGKLKGVSSECIIPHFKPKFDLKSCNKTQFYICREIIMAELVLTKVHFCPNCENENAYDTCICKCCVAKELMNLCYKPNCDDELELSRYHRYIEDTCKIKPVVVIDDNKKRDEVYEAVSEETTENLTDNPNSSEVAEVSEANELIQEEGTFTNEANYNSSEIIDEATNTESPINKSKMRIQAKKESLKSIEQIKNKRFDQEVKLWEVQYLENEIEDEIIEDAYIEADYTATDDKNLIIYSQEDLEELEANGCNPYEVTGECYHEQCCYPPKATTKTVYDVTTETDIMYSTILRYKLDAKTTTETQLLENTITIQVPETTVTTTKYKKKLVPKFKKTVTLTTTQVSVLTVTVTTTAASAANAAAVATDVNNFITRFENLQQVPNRRPIIPNLIRMFGTSDNDTFKNGSTPNNATRPYNGNLVLRPLHDKDTRYSQNSTLGNSSTVETQSSSSNSTNSTVQSTFNSLGKMNKTNKTGIVVSLITIVVAFLVTVKNSFESGDVANEHEVVVTDLLQNASKVEQRGVLSDSLNSDHENDNQEFSFVKDELSRLSMNTHTDLTDHEILENLVGDNY